MSEKKVSEQITRSNQASISIDWSYADAPESTSHVRFNKHYGLFIDGSFTEYNENQSFESINPANGESL